MFELDIGLIFITYILIHILIHILIEYDEKYLKDNIYKDNFKYLHRKYN